MEIIRTLIPFDGSQSKVTIISNEEAGDVVVSLLNHPNLVKTVTLTYSTHQVIFTRGQ